MRRLILFFLLLFIQSVSFAQKIDYTIPESVGTKISAAEYKKIVDLALPVVKKRYDIDHVEAGAIILKQDQAMQAFNLDNLILKCVSEKDQKLWKSIIEDHFSQLFASIDEQKKLDPENFGSVKKYLSLRIYSKSTFDKRGGTANLIARTDLEGTYTLLMLDLPDAFTAVDGKMFTRWKKDTAAVFAFAQANINKQPVEKVTQSFKIDGSDIEISFIGDENYAASYALDLATNSPELVGQWGAVIAIPNRGLADICKVSKEKPLDFVKFIQRTKPLTEKSYADHPQPISSDYFWYYKGKFTKINVLTDSNGKLSVVAPMGLSILMTGKN